MPLEVVSDRGLEVSLQSIERLLVGFGQKFGVGRGQQIRKCLLCF